MQRRRTFRVRVHTAWSVGLVGLCLLSACGGGDGSTGPAPAVPVASVRVTPSAPTVVAGATVQLAAAALDASGAALSGRTATWQSDAPTVATVSAAGVVTGVSSGTAGIRATIEGVSGTASVTVTPVPVASVTLTPATPSLEAGDTLTLSAQTRDAQGAVLTGRTVQWTVTNTAVATVNTNGLVTAVAAGSTTVRATNGTVSGEVPLVVLPAAVAVVELSRDSAMLVPNQPLALSATLRDARQNTLSGRTVSWQSSAPTVATVSASGAVVAVSPGTATITASSEAKSDSATLTVRAGGWVTPAGGTVTAGAVTLTVPTGAAAAPLAITVQPLAAPPADARLLTGTAHEFGPDGTTFAQPVTVRISYAANTLNGANAADLALHRYSGTAWVPVAGSTVDVGASTVSGQATSLGRFAVLEVPPPVASISLSPTVASVAVGESVALVPTVRDAMQNVLTNRVITWSSSNSALATVSATGTVTGVANGGPVAITATSEGRTATAQITVETDFAFKQLAVGRDHSCGLSTAGAAFCWGANESGQLGINATSPFVFAQPRPVSGGHVFSAVYGGESFSCALTATGAAYCWGENFTGQVGDGTTTERRLPTAVAGARVFTKLATGEHHACGLSANGVVQCWGANADGGLGDGTFIPRLVPTPVSGNHNFVDIAGGEDFTCALTSQGAAWCWGDNGFGQLGIGSSGTNIAAPTQVVGGHAFTSISNGEDHACAVKQNGEAWCWGRGGLGRLGNGTEMDSNVPVRVAGSHEFASVAGFEEHSCGLLTNGRVLCWGQNAGGELGDGTSATRLAPTAIAGNLTFVQLADGYSNHSCARTAGGQAWCWGSNTFGDIGTGSFGGVIRAPSRVVDGDYLAR